VNFHGSYNLRWDTWSNKNYIVSWRVVPHYNKYVALGYARNRRTLLKQRKTHTETVIDCKLSQWKWDNVNDSYITTVCGRPEHPGNVALAFDVRTFGVQACSPHLSVDVPHYVPISRHVVACWFWHWFFALSSGFYSNLLTYWKVESWFQVKKIVLRWSFYVSCSFYSIESCGVLRFSGITPVSTIPGCLQVVPTNYKALCPRRQLLIVSLRDVNA